MKKSILFGVTSIAMFTLLGAGCVQETSTPVTTSTTTPVKDGANQNVAVADDSVTTTTGETYTNETWGYAFTIPEDRWVDDETNGDDLIYVREYLADGSQTAGGEIGFSDFSVAAYEDGSVALEPVESDTVSGCVVYLNGNDDTVIQFMAHECLASETMDDVIASVTFLP